MVIDGFLTFWIKVVNFLILSMMCISSSRSKYLACGVVLFRWCIRDGLVFGSSIALPSPDLFCNRKGLGLYNGLKRHANDDGVIVYFFPFLDGFVESHTSYSWDGATCRWLQLFPNKRFPVNCNDVSLVLHYVASWPKTR